jgi:hypothetical protein
MTEFIGALLIKAEASPKSDKVKAAYAASDGTEMIEIGPHQCVNRCAFEKHKHDWQRVRGNLVCRCCKQVVHEGEHVLR